MLEKEIEQYLRIRVKAIGGLCYKWVSPGNSGVPDRIVVLPEGRVFFIELKSSTGVLSKIQKMQHRRIEKRGARVSILSSKQEVDEFLREVMSR